MIPSFIQLLEDEDEGVRLIVVEVIGELANHREWYIVGKHCGTADGEYKVEFREAIARTIPFLMLLLDDEREDIRQGALELFGNLANHGEGELKNPFVVARLTQTIKMSFVKPPRA
jgi:HEAT repeat protein